MVHDSLNIKLDLESNENYVENNNNNKYIVLHLLFTNDFNNSVYNALELYNKIVNENSNNNNNNEFINICQIILQNEKKFIPK